MPSKFYFLLVPFILSSIVLFENLDNTDRFLRLSKPKFTEDVSN